MNADLEKTVEELGPDYCDVVARLRASREVEPGKERRGPWLEARGPWLAAASLAAALALAVLYVLPRGGDTVSDVPLTIYTVAYAPTEEALELIVASQRADGSWSNDFLTRQNAAALRASDDARMRVAYRRAVRYLRTKGLSPLTDAELKERGEYAAKFRFGA
jgi:hypothetical protein